MQGSARIAATSRGAVRRWLPGLNGMQETLLDSLVVAEVGQRSQTVRNQASRTRQALVDLWSGLILWRLWIMFGWIDIRQRYRRALIGPFWITISMAVMVVTLGIIYSSL